MPVMEGKAVLFKEFGGRRCLAGLPRDTGPDGIVAAVTAIAPGFGGINLEDISAPRCFEIEARLRGPGHPRLPRRPARHGDGGRRGVPERARWSASAEDVEVVVTGVGAAESRQPRCCWPRRAQRHRLRPRGAIHLGRGGLTELKTATRSARTRAASRHRRRGTRGADVFLGLSGPGAVSARRRSPRWRTTQSSSRWPTRHPR